MDDLLEFIGEVGQLDRPLLDRTGLSGTFDMSLDYNVQVPPGSDWISESRTVFLQAVNDQLGLKLESITAPVRTLVIDHIEEPTPN